jgi:hypothetical protein
MATHPLFLPGNVERSHTKNKKLTTLAFRQNVDIPRRTQFACFVGGTRRFCATPPLLFGVRQFLFPYVIGPVLRKKDQ